MDEFCKKDILVKLQKEYKILHNFYNDPELFIPDIVINSYLEIYSLNFDQRMDNIKLKVLIEEFIENELKFINYNIKQLKIFSVLQFGLTTKITLKYLTNIFGYDTLQSIYKFIYIKGKFFYFCKIIKCILYILRIFQ